jgi:hypothetical protein
LVCLVVGIGFIRYFMTGKQWKKFFSSWSPFATPLQSWSKYSDPDPIPESDPFFSWRSLYLS